MSELRLRARLQPRGPAAAIILDDEQAASFGAGKAFPVTVSIGDAQFRGRCCRMGGENLIGLSKAARAQLGVDIGQQVDVVLSLDTAERTVDVPADLATALAADPAAQQAFDALSYTRRKEIAASIRDAKRPETRQWRLAKALQELAARP